MIRRVLVVVVELFMCYELLEPGTAPVFEELRRRMPELLAKACNHSL